MGLYRHFLVLNPAFRLMFGLTATNGPLPERNAAQFGDWNLLISLFGFLLGAAQLVFLYYMIVSWRFGPRAPANPWGAKSIEWQVSSPPPRFDFDRIPRVVGGPYEFGIPGARHVLMGDEQDAAAAPSPTEKLAAG